jgi:hypothetical protein
MAASGRTSPPAPAEPSGRYRRNLAVRLGTGEGRQSARMKPFAALRDRRRVRREHRRERKSATNCHNIDDPVINRQAHRKPRAEHNRHVIDRDYERAELARTDRNDRQQKIRNGKLCFGPCRSEALARANPSNATRARRYTLQGGRLFGHVDRRGAERGESRSVTNQSVDPSA